MIKRVKVILTTAVFILFLPVFFSLPGVLAGAEVTITGSSTQVTAYPAPQYDPSISGDVVVYSDRRNGNDDIYFTDLSTSTEMAVTTAPGSQVMPDISGDTIVYMDSSVFPVQVWAYDIPSGTSSQIAPSPYPERDPSISGSVVAFEIYPGGPRTNADVAVSTLATGTYAVIAGTSAHEGRPVVGGNLVAFERGAVPLDPNGDIVVYDLVSGMETVVGKGLEPHTDGRRVAWWTGAASTADIIVLDMATGASTTVAYAGAQNRPRISGDILAFDDNSLGSYDVVLLHLPSGATYRIDSASTEFLNDLDGNRVAYTSNETGTYDIFVFSFTVLLVPPVADAGIDQTVHVGTVVTIDGSGSSDPDGNYPLTYAWVITSMPSDSSAVLSDPTAVNPSFTADKTGDFIATLTVTDSLGAASAADEVIVSTTNTRPVADAGPDQSVILMGTTVALDGTRSWDDDGDPLTYSWTMTKPAGSTATLSDLSSPAPTFTADIQGTYTAELVVSDPWVSSDPDTVTVSFENVKPVANAGGNQAVSVGDTVVLYGGDSSDANGDPLTYNWSLVSTPAGSAATLTDATSQTATFVADKGGTYVVSLVVNDGLVDSDPANATIMATSNKQGVIDKLKEGINVINNNLPCSSLKNCNHKNALTNKINAAIGMIEQGLYEDALDKLETDIIGKTDGCANSGAPDKNDWLTDCASQNQVYPLLMEAVNLLRQML